MSWTIFLLNNMDEEVNIEFFYILELSHHEIAIAIWLFYQENFIHKDDIDV